MAKVFRLKYQFLSILFFISTFQSHGFANVPTSSKNKITFSVEKYQLPNGLTVLIHEDHTMPLISFQQWFRVGSSYEKPGRTGLAHFFEHLMFKGTKKYPLGVIDRLIDKNGGSKNAFTTEDITGYYTDMPSDQLELIMDVESDRMRQLLFDQKEIDSEREVVKEERRMRYENSVYGSMAEKIRNVRYKTSPYRWPVIGYMADLNATSMDELKLFYQQYYAPNNAVIVIAGDVDVAETKKLVEKYYGGIARQSLPQFKPTPEAVQKAPRSAKIARDVQSPTLAVVYPAPGADSDDIYALDVLAAILGSGSSSRLHKRLVYKGQMATQASVSNSNDKLSGDLSVIVALNPGRSVNKVLPVLDEEIQKVKTERVDESELKKVKKKIKLSFVEGLQTMSSRAQALASAEVMQGDYRKIFSDMDKYEQVTAEDIKRVANKYFDSNKKNIVQVVPTAHDNKKQVNK